MKKLFLIFILLLLSSVIIFSELKHNDWIVKPIDKTIHVTATVYNACPIQCNADYMTTAFGFKINKDNPYGNKFIAISRDLMKYFNKGDSVFIIGTIYDDDFIIADKMHKRWKNKIDILINKDMPIGKWDSVKIIKF